MIRTDAPHPSPVAAAPVVRESVFAAALPWVRTEAERVKAKFADNPEFDADDLFQVGALAAWEMAGKWDRSVSLFRTFAALRVHGAMIDFIRGGVSVRRVRRDHGKAGRLSSARLPELLAASVADECEDAAGVEFAATVRRLDAGSSDRERAILSRYFVDGLRMKQVGQEEGLSESRVSQLIAGVVGRIRERCEARGLTRRTAFA